LGAARLRRPNNDMKTMIACLAIQAVLVGRAFAQQPPSPPAQSAQPAQPVPPSAPAAPAVPGQSVIGGLELKAALCQIDGILAPMDGQSVPAAESSLCQPSFSIENVPMYITTGGGAMDYGHLGNALVAYYEFRALAFGGTQQCAPLVNLQATTEKVSKMSLTVKSNWESNCRTHTNEMRFVQAVVTHDPKAVEACQTMVSSDPDPESERRGEAGEMCHRAASASDIKAFGETVCNGNPAKKGKCLAFFGAISGDASACRALTSEALSHRDLCRGYVAFAKAGPAKNPALCGDNDVCLAMTGSAVRAVVNAQGAVAASLGTVLLPLAQAKLKALVAGVDPANAAAAKELDARAERIARLRLKYDPTSRKSATVKKGAGNAQEDK
jgi:hypothetical protein